MTYSFETHHSQYSEPEAFEREIKIHKVNTETKAQYKSDNPLGLSVDLNPQLKVAIDIGSGTGWASNYLSERMEKVYSVEPSSAALEIAKKIYPNLKNVEWVVDFAGSFLSTLEPLNTPTLFNSLVVLSHLSDPEALEICKQINRVAPLSSVLSFSEVWGPDHHEPLWHSRTQDWWKRQFSDWDFVFCGPAIQHPKSAFKGFSATRKALSK